MKHLFILLHSRSDPEGEVVPMEKLPLMDKQQGSANEEAVRVVANIQIQNRDSICSNIIDEPVEEYVGQVTHLRSIKVSLRSVHLALV